MIKIYTKFICLFLVVLLHRDIFGQQIGFLDSTFIWTENHQFCCTGLFSESFRYTMDSHPTIFSGKKYYAVLESHEEESEDWGNTYNYLRFENKVVYQYNFSDEVELYNFNLMIGDTFSYAITEIVDSIDTVVLLTGEVRKRWKLRCIYDDPENAIRTEWIEGIGNINGLFYYNSMSECTADSDGSDIMCIFRNDTLLYDDPFYSGCWMLPTDTDEENISELSLTPNPAVDLITLSGLPEELLTVKIFNSIGNLVYNGNSRSIEVNNFTPGYHAMVITSDHGHSYVKGFIKF